MKAQEERSQGNPKREARETRWEERQQGMPVRYRQDSDASGDRELQGVFLAPRGLAEKLQGMAGPNSSAREKRLLQGMIQTWQQEIDKEREAMSNEDIQREENPKGNRYPPRGLPSSSSSRKLVLAKSSQRRLSGARSLVKRSQTRVSLQKVPSTPASSSSPSQRPPQWARRRYPRGPRWKGSYPGEESGG